MIPILSSRETILFSPLVPCGVGTKLFAPGALKVFLVADRERSKASLAGCCKGERLDAGCQGPIFRIKTRSKDPAQASVSSALGNYRDKDPPQKQSQVRPQQQRPRASRLHFCRVSYPCETGTNHTGSRHDKTVLLARSNDSEWSELRAPNASADDTLAPLIATNY